MGLFPRLRRKMPGPEDDFWYSYPGISTKTGVQVSEKTALKYLTVYACTTLIAGDVARLPLNLYKRKKGGGKDIVTENKKFDLLHNAPNEEMTSFLWREASQGHLLLWGNTYSFISRDTAGKIVGLHLFADPSKMEVARKGGNLLYTYKDDGKAKTFTRDEIFHIPGYGFNGIVGQSMIAVAREAIGMGLSAEEYGATFFSEGTHPSGVLELDTTLGDNRKAFTDAVQAGYAGLGKAHQIMVMEAGAKYKPLNMSMDDAQFLETRDHQKIEICGMYHLPPHKIAIHGQNSNYNNLEQENASYVDSCLMHWLVRWESAISQQLLTEAERMSGLFFEFLVTGLLRGDSAARAEYYNKIFQVGGITPDEIRAKENMNPVDGGDQSFVMLNMVPLAKAEEMAEKQLKEPQKPPPFGEKPPPEEEKEPEKEKKGNFKSFFSEKRAKTIAEREKRSVQARDKISKQYRPLILEAASAVVNKESGTISRKLQGTTTAAMKKFLKEFYSNFGEYVTRKMKPVLTSYIQAIINETTSEIGVDDVKLDVEIKEYIDRYAERHTDSSLGQLLKLLEDDLSKVEERADEWQEKRPEKITNDETVRASGAAFSWVVFGVGMSLVWRIRGADTCPYCKSLNGKRIARGGTFASPGDEIDPKGGNGPMKINGIKQHAPLHQGCDCYMSAI